MRNRWTSMPAGRRLGAGLLGFSLLGALGLWWTSRDSTPEQSARLWRPSSEFHNSRSPEHRQRSLFVVRHLEGRQRASFAVFRTSPEPLPLPMRRPIHGINWRLAQRLPIRDPARAWAVPGDKYICILSLQVRRGHGAVGATCESTEAALAHGLATTLLSDPESGVAHRSARVIVGIAPDQAREVIAIAAGSTVRIPVVSGVFIRRDSVGSPPDRFRLIGRSEVP